MDKMTPQRVGDTVHILVIGGAGFIGSHLCDHLIADGHSIVVVDDLSLGLRENVTHLLSKSGFAFHEMSILDPAFEAVFKEGKFDCVFHVTANSWIICVPVGARSCWR